VRFFAVYTAVLLAAYSAIPYKTPWCVLGPLDGLVLLAGVGAAAVVRAARSRGAKAAAVVLLAAAGAHLLWQAWAASFPYAADPRNPWVYAHTSTDVFTIVSTVESLAAVHPDGRGLPIQVVASTNVWPLPWYLRRFTHVAWWTGVSDAAGNAPLILATPDMEAALVHRMYDLPPPGERELYVPVFDRPVELRTGVEIRGYATHRLWERHLQREAP
jgi:predicted membrane-bound mannosyltransferase